MSKHTQGPWTVTHLVEGKHVEGRSADEGEDGTAKVYWVSPKKGSGPYMSSGGCMNYATARLIAASPELFALANRVANLNEHAGEIGAGMLASLIEDARAAVAKATGGEG